MTSLARTLLHSTADRHPERIAVETDTVSVTFAELCELVDRRVDYLVSHVVLDDSTSWAPLLVDYSLDSVVSVLACLTGSIPFAPLDSEVPSERLRRLLSLLGNPRQVIGAPKANSVLPEGASLLTPTLSEGRNRPVYRDSDPEDTHLVVTTSGTTGTPKAVLVSFSVVNERITIAQRRYDFDAENPHSSLMSPLHFMGGIVGLLPLLFGESIVFLDPRRYSPKDLLQRLVAANLTQLYVTPQICRLLSLLPETVPGRFHRLRTIVTGAETMRYEYFSGLSRRVPKNAELIQIFGSSEAPQSFMSRAQVACMPSRGVMPLGDPTDPDNIRLVPLEGGDEGLHELWRAGPILSGYLGAPELNERQFHIDGEGKRWWKSGDLFVKSTEGGWIFSGRSDDMVKIHGKLASPAEVVKVLAEVPSVRASLVLPETEDGRTRFVAHIEVNSVGEVDAAEVRRFLSAQLPTHLVPARFHFYESLPLTVRGKTDRKALREGTLPPDPN